MRADRLLSILLLLQVHRRMTARELAERLEVSERTIHRDMEALSAAGVPVVADRGAGGGWSLPEGYQTNLTGLTAEEAQALLVMHPFRMLADLGLGPAAESALVKLQAALPATHRRDAEELRQRIYIDPTGWRGDDDVTFLPILQDAVWQEREVRLAYQRGDNTTVERTVGPLGLVAKGKTWYLVAMVDGEFRTYRVGRVRGAEITGQVFRRPPDFDLVAHWNQSQREFVATLSRYPARVRVNPAILPRMRYGGKFARLERVGEPERDGWVTVDILFEIPEDAQEYCLGYGANLEVLEPPELRAGVIAAARAALARYGVQPAPAEGLPPGSELAASPDRRV